ncbi:MAG: hypothetical protein LBG59_08480 [Candidatus Peribacteria bacterium]|nr:hypothetical protein [Candidatus Peribacteria bacterium]
MLSGLLPRSLCTRHGVLLLARPHKDKTVTSLRGSLRPWQPIYVGWIASSYSVKIPEKRMGDNKKISLPLDFSF